MHLQMHLQITKIKSKHEFFSTVNDRSEKNISLCFSRQSLAFDDNSSFHIFLVAYDQVFLFCHADKRTPTKIVIIHLTHEYSFTCQINIIRCQKMVTETLPSDDKYDWVSF